MGYSKKYYWATLADTARTTLTWSPSSAPGGEVSLSPGLPIEQPVLTVYTGDVLSPIDPTLEIYPAVDDVDFRDYIIWFPQDSGLPPVYVMLKSPRDEPGVVTGVGSVVTGLWLNETTRGRGALFLRLLLTNYATKILTALINSDLLFGR